jgi:hypothetical protein
MRNAFDCFPSVTVMREQQASWHSIGSPEYRPHCKHASPQIAGKNTGTQSRNVGPPIRPRIVAVYNACDGARAVRAARTLSGNDRFIYIAVDIASRRSHCGKYVPRQSS